MRSLSSSNTSNSNQNIDINNNNGNISSNGSSSNNNRKKGVSKSFLIVIGVTVLFSIINISYSYFLTASISDDPHLVGDNRDYKDDVADSESNYVSNNNNNISAPLITHLPPLSNNKLNLTDTPVYIGGCCGVGHRLSYNIPTIHYAYMKKQQAHVIWDDVQWKTLFNDTHYIKNGDSADGYFKKIVSLKRSGADRDVYGHDFYSACESPDNWNFDAGKGYNPSTQSVLDKYITPLDMVRAMDMPLVQSLLVHMRDSFSPLVHSYIDSIRRQTNQNILESDMDYYDIIDMKDDNILIDNENGDESRNDYEKGQNHVKVCAHIREGNKETGDWEGKTWRHINLDDILQSTRNEMITFAQNQKKTKTKGGKDKGHRKGNDNDNDNHQYVSVYVASDNPIVREWFEDESNIPTEYGPKYWKTITPDKVAMKPKAGVWFGEQGSNTSSVLDQSQKDEAMAEVIAEIFALGECDALFIPNYSSFSFVSITLTRARGGSVFFRKTSEGPIEWGEMSALLELG